MIAKIRVNELSFEPMTKFEYYDKIRKFQIQHPENKWIDGYYCDWLGFKFWLRKDDFNLLFEEINNED